MYESRIKTMRHIETVRNFMNTFIRELLHRQEQHDQTKLQEPEVEVFDEYTNKLRSCTYGSPEYTSNLQMMHIALDHHYANNPHHPEYHRTTEIPDQSLLERMTLIDIVEMFCDWSAATLRHSDGDILESIDKNQERFGYSDELAQIMKNTAVAFYELSVYHCGKES